MSNPRTKRQFAGAAADPTQRQITSFFSLHSTDASSTQSHRATRTSPVSTPRLPAAVQANLLSVGMRVRKSVPEGYKTGAAKEKDLGSGWWDHQQPAEDNYSNNNDNNNSALNPFTASFSSRQYQHQPNPRLSHRHHYETQQRELSPFCGIHKVGGLATQTTISSSSSSDDELDDDTPPLFDIPGLSSSQETVSSEILQGRKRPHEHEADEEEDMCMDGEPVFTGWGGKPGWENGLSGRVVAVPRRRGRQGGAVTTIEGVGVKDVMGGATGVGNDFEDAEFLDWRGMDVD